MSATRLPIRLVVALLAGAALSANAQGAPCFTVSGEMVSINKLFKDGKPQVVELDNPMASGVTSTIASRGAESHNLVFSNVKRDASKKNVTEFSAKIDGKDYAFPKDACR